MIPRTFYTLLSYLGMTTLLATLTACNEEIVSVIRGPENVGDSCAITLQVSPIADVTESAATRKPSFIDGAGKVAAFEKDTRISLLYVAKDKTSGSEIGKYTVGRAFVKGSTKSFQNFTDGVPKEYQQSELLYGAENVSYTYSYTEPGNPDYNRTASIQYGTKRYWNDAYGPDSEISAYGFCIKDVVLPSGAPWNQKISEILNNDNPVWYATDHATKQLDSNVGAESSEGAGKVTMPWIVGNHNNNDNYRTQTFNSLLYKDDVCYSNNLSGEGILKYNSSTREYDTGTMLFKRAMCLFSINLYAGDYFKGTTSGGITSVDPKFSFLSDTNIAMQGFNKSGYLDITTGTWNTITDGSGITNRKGDTPYGSMCAGWTSICNTNTSGQRTDITNPVYTLLAFVIPGTDLSTSPEQNAMRFTIDGVSYVLSMRDIYDALVRTATAQRKDINTFLEDGTKLKAGINYDLNIRVDKKAIDVSAKVSDWSSLETLKYNAKVKFSDVVSVSGSYDGAVKTGGFDIYHKRDAGGTYAKATSMTYNATPDTWSASAMDYWIDPTESAYFRALSPANAGTSLTNGTTDVLWGTVATAAVDTQVSPSAIPFVFRHALAKLSITLKDVNEGESNALDLTDATVEISGIAKAGTLNLHNGTVEAGAVDGEVASVDVSTPYYVVPQKLTDEAKLIVTLADNSVYQVQLNQCRNGSDAVIGTWQAGAPYEYTVNLAKPAVGTSSGSVSSWASVNAISTVGQYVSP